MDTEYKNGFVDGVNSARMSMNEMTDKLCNQLINHVTEPKYETKLGRWLRTDGCMFIYGMAIGCCLGYLLFYFLVGSMV